MCRRVHMRVELSPCREHAPRFRPVVNTRVNYCCSGVSRNVITPKGMLAESSDEYFNARQLGVHDLIKNSAEENPERVNDPKHRSPVVTAQHLRQTMLRTTN